LDLGLLGLKDELLAEAKRHATETRRTLTQLIRDALIAQLEREAEEHRLER